MRALVVIGVMTGVAASHVGHADNLSVTYTTSANGGQFAPRYVSATWVEDAGGNFIKTIDRKAGVRVGSLVAWIAKSGQDSDAITGATQVEHTTPIAMHWDLKDRNGNVVPDGTYTIRMETSDTNATQPAQNHQGSFTFVKGPTASTQTNLANGGFTGGVVIFALGTCANDVIDAGETCDGNCPVSCSGTGNACAVVTLVGDPAMCNSKCDVQYITSCIDGDGCCATGCDQTTDTDCIPGAGSGSGGGGDDPNSVVGGCATGSGTAPAVMLVLASCALLLRRRPRGA
jgi:hypothetical protein